MKKLGNAFHEGLVPIPPRYCQRCGIKLKGAQRKWCKVCAKIVPNRRSVYMPVKCKHCGAPLPQSYKQEKDYCLKCAPFGVFDNYLSIF